MTVTNERFLAWAGRVASDAAAYLTSDGDSMTLDDGRVMTLSIGLDEWTSIFDNAGKGTWIGMLAWADRSRDYCGRWDRPAWADGGAELLSSYRGDRLWWRPDADVLRDQELRDRLRRPILELLESGYSVVSVKIDGETGHSVGGVEPAELSDIADIVGDLAYSALWEARERQERAYVKGCERIVAQIGMVA